MNFKKIINWFSIIGSIASVVGFVYVFYPLRDDFAELQFIIKSCDNLTNFNSAGEPEIKASFEYKEARIDNLWKLNVLILNSSEKTIVGKGQLKNILYENLFFLINEDFRILDKKLIATDLSHDLIVQGDDTLVLSFAQWRRQEKLEYSFYITSSKSTPPSIEDFFQPKDRQIIDGEIEFIRELPPAEKALITSRLGDQMRRVSYVLFICVSLILLLLFIIILISNPVSYYLKQNWKKKYAVSFSQHIMNVYHDNIPLQKRLLEKPELYKNWMNFDGEKYPVEWGLDFDISKKVNLLLTEIALVVLSIAQTIVLIDLIQLFP